MGRVALCQTISISVCFLWGGLALGCGSSHAIDKSIEQRWQWDGGVEALRALERVKDARGPARRSVVVGVTGIGLRGKELPNGPVWEFATAVNVLPIIRSDAVLFTAQGILHALDAATGKLLFKLDVSGRRLEGAGYDGKHFILLLVDEDDARQDQVRVVSTSGRDVLSFSVDARLGTPAAVAGVGLVPYAGQYVAAFDLQSGDWIGRLLYRDALHTVSADDQGVLLWGAGATLLKPDVAKSPESQSLRFEHGEFPGDPSWPADGSKPRPARAQPITLLAHPQLSEGKLRFAGDRYVATYYQIALAKELGTGDLLWVNHLPHAISGAALGGTSALLCLDDGSIVRLALDNGHAEPAGSLNARLKACSVSTADEPVAAAATLDLRDQIVEAITNTGADMAQVQRLLLDELTDLRGVATTRSLLTIAQDPKASTELARHAGELLSSRKDGGREMVRALDAYADERAARLAQVPTTSPDLAGAQVARSEPRLTALRPPPVGPIAKALLKQKTPGAALALARYLDDPSLSANQTRTVMKTIFALGNAEQIAPVHHFVLTYKNTGGDPDLIDALVQAVEFLLIHMDETMRAHMKAEIDESLTFPELKRRARNIKVKRPVPPSPRADEPTHGTPDQKSKP